MFYDSYYDYLRSLNQTMYHACLPEDTRQYRILRRTYTDRGQSAGRMDRAALRRRLQVRSHHMDFG